MTFLRQWKHIIGFPLSRSIHQYVSGYATDIYTIITSVCILYTLIDGFKFTYNVIIILWKTTKRYESDGPC
jgi:hypothetical protein